MFFAQRTSVSDPYSLNPDPDPAKNLNPDPSYFLTQSEKNIIFFHNDRTFSSKEVNRKIECCKKLHYFVII